MPKTRYNSETGCIISITHTTSAPSTLNYEMFARAKFTRVLSRYQNLIIDMLDETTKTWNEETPKWKRESADWVGGDLILSVTADASNDFGAAKWKWLDEGTPYRWAMMTRGFVAKTSPGGWLPDKGSGGVAFATKSAFEKRKLGPQPGIEARQWTQYFPEYFEESGHVDDLEQELLDVCEEIADEINNDNYRRVEPPQEPTSISGVGLDASWYTTKLAAIKGKKWGEF